MLGGRNKRSNSLAILCWFNWLGWFLNVSYDPWSSGWSTVAVTFQIGCSKSRPTAFCSWHAWLMKIFTWLFEDKANLRFAIFLKGRYTLIASLRSEAKRSVHFWGVKGLFFGRRPATQPPAMSLRNHMLHRWKKSCSLGPFLVSVGSLRFHSEIRLFCVNMWECIKTATPSDLVDTQKTFKIMEKKNNDLKRARIKGLLGTIILQKFTGTSNHLELQKNIQKQAASPLRVLEKKKTP